MQLPPVPAGLALAAALAAVMSTSSGALIATATVFSEDIVALLRGRDIVAGSEHDHIRSNRLYVAGFGIIMVVVACASQDVVAALTVAYGSSPPSSPASRSTSAWPPASWYSWSAVCSASPHRPR